MWFQHALHGPSGYTAHQPLGFVPHFSHFHERITLIIQIENTVA
jgi:hypothetical protein